MKKSAKILVWTIIGLLVLVGIVYVARTRSAVPGKYDQFATCLKDKGAVFYGAFWCPHCQNQKKMFGKSEKLLPYVECSTPNGQGQLQVCIDAGIQSYPTWEFSDGSRLNGEIPLQTLAEKTNCELSK